MNHPQRSSFLLWCLGLVALLAVNNATLSAQDKAPAANAKPKSLQPEVQTAEWAVKWWMPRHEQKLKEKEQLADCQLLWIGDSITHGWENAGKEIWEARYAPLKALNLGFSGDRTEQVLWRLEHDAVKGISPKLAIIMIGTNNAGHRKDPAAETAAGIQEIVSQLRQRLPKTKILLLGIFPRGETPNDELRKLNTETNAIIAKLADGKDIVFLDISNKFLDADGKLSKEIMPDMLHPNTKGYEIWSDAIADQVKALTAN